LARSTGLNCCGLFGQKVAGLGSLCEKEVSVLRNFRLRSLAQGKRKYILGLLTVVFITSIGVTTFVAAAGQTLPGVTLNAGDSVTVSCKNGNLTLTGSGTANISLKCPDPVSPTPTPTPTPGPVPGKGVCGESEDVWHPPVVTGPDGKPCNTGHEHGDAPPSWIAAAGYKVSFVGGFNTSALENTAKHAAMKGFSAKFGNTDVYVRVHAASNPLDRMARYHSYEAWARDPSGNVSHWQLWYNTGDPVKDRIPRRQGVEPSQRPIMLVVDQTSWDQGIRCEQWYTGPGEPQWGWDLGWTICNATTLYVPGESLSASDQRTWKLAPDGSLGGTRRLEAAWYSNRPHPTGKFYSTQFGEIVSGPTDARCSQTTTKFNVTYPNVCLEQYIAPTMQQVAFPGNALQKTFNTTGVKIPN
jgi:hypothetical protein